MKKKDFIVIIAIVIVAAVIYFGIQLFNNNSSGYGVVKHGDDVILTFDVSKDHIYEFDGSWGHMKLEVKSGKWRIFDEDCPNHDCSSLGWVGPNDLMPIICLPNEVIVEYSGEN